jgi:uncharacterized protein with FMN-binding domain
MTATDTTRPNPDAAGSIEAARHDRRRRTIYASLAGWTLLGAASVGLVACSSAGTTSTAATPAASTVASSAASSAATSAADSSPASAAAGDATSAAATTEAAATTGVTEAAAGTAYQDGTYTATGSYTSPGGTEEVTITLTLTGDTITAATAEGGATKPPSSQYQGEFVDNFAALIIGKDVADVTLDKVAGSSLTSGGFNKAVETIKSQAQA